VKLTVTVKPNSRAVAVKETGPGQITVHVTAPPVDGKANDQLVEVLSDHFGKPKRCITILRGESSKHKIVEIL
jgi:uncharacterized protein